ncbi:hypothetical protein G6F32_015926 [Rhizopus arrhizus]|nr:hypothetical protein G6F32_015926 [Rhizopus arrhizus]
MEGIPAHRRTTMREQRADHAVGLRPARAVVVRGLQHVDIGDAGSAPLLHRRWQEQVPACLAATHLGGALCGDGLQRTNRIEAAKALAAEPAEPPPPQMPSTPMRAASTYGRVTR